MAFSQAISEYVWKEETSLGERFEYGSRPIKRNDAKDWDAIKKLAQEGNIEQIPGDIYIRYYSNLKRIGADYLRPVAQDRRVYLLWGATSTGKSHRAWNTLPFAYSKDPRTKWWVGYRGEPDVIIDEFRGGIDIGHILRWFDRYPVQVETKGGATALQAARYIITSNIPFMDWYPLLDRDTLAALERRLNIIHVTSKEQEINLFLS